MLQWMSSKHNEWLIILILSNFTIIVNILVPFNQLIFPVSSFEYHSNQFHRYSLGLASTI